MQPFTLELLKGHGSENTFFIIDNMNLNIDDESKSSLTKILCTLKTDTNQQTVDGVLFMEPGKENPTLMRIFNADGSEALMCGNGMRLAGRWALNYLNTSKTIVENVTNLPYLIEESPNFGNNVFGTQIALPAAIVNGSFIYQGTKTYKQEPIEAFDPSRKYSSINMPNPHIIAIVTEINDLELEAVGFQANSNKNIFPSGVNVSWVQWQDEQNIFVSTYERGVGLTSSCGTAMMASSIVSVQEGPYKYGQILQVNNKGGYILAQINEDLSSTMIGNATYLGKMTVAIEDGQVTIVSPLEVFTEQDAYEALKRK